MFLAPFISRTRRKIWLWTLASVGAVLGALPDLLGQFGIVLIHDGGKLYDSAHCGAVRSVLQYVPMYWLHLFLDSYMHDPELRWHGIYLRPTLELLLWVMNIVLIVWFVRIFKRNAQSIVAEQP